VSKLKPASKLAGVVAAVGVAVATTILILSSGTSPSAVDVPSGSPAFAAERFLAAWERSDWVTVSSLMSVPESQIDEMLAEWWKELHVVEVRFTAGTPQIIGLIAQVPFHAVVEIEDVGTWEYDSELRLAPSDDDWAIVSGEQVMHPTLSSGDRLDLIAVWPQRGLITDYAGRPLTGSIPRVTIGLVPERIVSREEVAAAFEEVLDLSSDVIDGVLDKPGVQPDWFLPVTTIDREDYVEVRPGLFPVPGVTFRLEPTRVAVQPGGAALLLGTTGEVTAESLAALGSPYTARSIVGISGLEASFERELAGTPTRRIVRRGADGSIDTIAAFPGTPASDLQTTLSIDVQRAAETALNGIGLPASIVAIDIGTGEIRAAASTPADGLRRATNGQYPPASTFKIIVAAALLEDGLELDTVVSCPRVVNVSGKEFRNAVTLPTSMTFEDAFAQSCNTAFIQLAADLGPEAIAQMAHGFGFGAQLDIGIRAADSSFPVSTDPVENAASAIGQGKVLASPLNLATVAATAASGVWHSPTLILGANTEAADVLDPSVVERLRLMMRAVVDHGTGQAASVAGLDIAGKTGTAQIATADGLDSVAWFIGFSGELAFAINVEGGTSGGSTAGPITAAFVAALAEPNRSSVAECVAAGSDWTTFQGDMTRSGCSQADPILTPTTLWQANVGISGWLNSPIVTNGLVVVGSAGDRRGAGDAADGVYALDLRTGQTEWQFGASNDVNGVAASGDLIIATGDEGTVWGIDLTTGHQIWSFSTGAPVFTNPLIVDDLVIVGDGSGVLWALNLDGTERWHAQLDGAIRGGAASDGTMVYAISDHGEATAFTLDGFQMWRTRIELTRKDPSRPETNKTVPVTVYATPTVADDKLIVAYAIEGGPQIPALIALDRYVGTIQWWGSDPNQPSDFANLRNSPARYGDTLIIASSISRGVQGVNATTGQAIWATETGVWCEKQWASAIVVGDLVVLPRPDGSVQAFDALNGETRWRMVPAGSSENAPISNCVGDGQQVHDGFELHASIAVAPNGNLVVASTSRAIYVIAENP